MAEFNETNKVEGVFGGATFEEQNNGNENVHTEGIQGEQVVQGEQDGTTFKKVDASELPAKQTIWSKIRSVLFKKRDLNSLFKIELTPYQQKVEDEINEFLHQEISFKGFFNFFKKSTTVLKKTTELNKQEKDSSLT